MEYSGLDTVQPTNPYDDVDDGETATLSQGHSFLPPVHLAIIVRYHAVQQFTLIMQLTRSAKRADLSVKLRVVNGNGYQL